MSLYGRLKNSQISLAPLFKQMEKIETHKKEIEEKLLTPPEINLDDKLVQLETFSYFSKIAKKSLSENLDMNLQKIILQKFIKRIAIGVNRVKIFWNVDQEHFNRKILFNKNQKASAEPAGVLPFPSNFLGVLVRIP